MPTFIPGEKIFFKVPNRPLGSHMHYVRDHPKDPGLVIITPWPGASNKSVSRSFCFKLAPDQPVMPRCPDCNGLTGKFGNRYRCRCKPRFPEKTC